MKQEDLERHVRATLDAGTPELDELTRAALKAARYRALEQIESQRRPWWQPALALTAMLLVLMTGWQMSQDVPAELQVAENMAADAAVIADLDLVLWLEQGEG